MERWIASVPPAAASRSSPSSSGMDEARTAVRVRMTVWAMPGRVSSCLSAAAAAA